MTKVLMGRGIGKLEGGRDARCSMVGGEEGEREREG